MKTISPFLLRRSKLERTKRSNLLHHLVTLENRIFIIFIQNFQPLSFCFINWHISISTKIAINFLHRVVPSSNAFTQGTKKECSECFCSNFLAIFNLWRTRAPLHRAWHTTTKRLLLARRFRTKKPRTFALKFLGCYVLFIGWTNSFHDLSIKISLLSLSHSTRTTAVPIDFNAFACSLKYFFVDSNIFILVLDS